jgi:hypothetical protein
MNYYTKYIKYKFKYLNLLNQIGGFRKEEIIEWKPKRLINVGAVCWMNAVFNFLLDIPELEHDKTDLIKNYIKIINQIAINNKTSKDNNLNFKAIIPIWCELVQNTTQYRTLTLPNENKENVDCNKPSHALLSVQVEALEILYDYLINLQSEFITIIKFNEELKKSDMNADKITTKYMFVYFPVPDVDDVDDDGNIDVFLLTLPEFKRTYGSYRIKGWLHRRGDEQYGHYFYINNNESFDDSGLDDPNYKHSDEKNTFTTSRCLLYELTK